MLFFFLCVVLYTCEGFNNPQVITKNGGNIMTTTTTNLKPFMISDDGLVIYHVGIKTNGQGFLKTNHGLVYVNTDGCTFSINHKKYNLFNLRVV